MIWTPEARQPLNIYSNKKKGDRMVEDRDSYQVNINLNVIINYQNSFIKEKTENIKDGQSYTYSTIYCRYLNLKFEFKHTGYS